MKPVHNALNVLLARTTDHLLLAGVSRKEVARLLRGAAHAAASGAPIAPHRGPSHYQFMMRVCGVLADWWRDRRFVDAAGNPKALPVRGRGPSLTSLIRQRFPAAKVDETIRWLNDARAIVRDEQGRVLPTTRALIVRSAGPLLVERAMTMAGRILKTTIHNYNSKGPTGTPDRVSSVPNLPAKHVRQFGKFVDAQSMLFLETIDNWLEDHKATKPGEPTMEVAVHVYLYKDAPTKKHARRKR